MRTEIERYMATIPCPTCNGMRLKPESRAVTVGGKNIIETTQLSIIEAQAWYERPARAGSNDRENRSRTRC